MPIKDPEKRREYHRNYAQLRRAGLTASNQNNQTGTPVVRIDDETLRLETVRDYLDVINRVISDVRDDVQSSIVQKARVVGYLVNIALKALELSSIEERLATLEQAVIETRREVSYETIT